MISMLECCLSSAILERKRYYPCWLLDVACVAACGLLSGYRVWIARRPSFGNLMGVECVCGVQVFTRILRSPK